MADTLTIVLDRVHDAEIEIRLPSMARVNGRRYLTDRRANYAGRLARGLCVKKAPIDQGCATVKSLKKCTAGLLPLGAQQVMRLR